jgi:hypothetical protein
MKSINTCYGVCPYKMLLHAEHPIILPNPSTLTGIYHTYPSISHNPRGLSPVCFLPPRESSTFPLAPPAAPPTEDVVSLTVLPAPLAVFPTPSVTPVTVSPSPFPRPASEFYQICSEFRFAKTPTADHIASSIRYTCRPPIVIHTRD